MHRLLARQIARSTRADGETDFQQLLAFVDATYADADIERARTERAMLLTCEEMDVLHDDLRRLAHTDSLTGLSNRASFAEAALRAMQRARAGENLAVLLIDLDRFKTINDTLGHAMGDALLCEVAMRLKDALRCDDTVARIGGDEFAILYVGFSEAHHAVELARRIVSRLAAPYVIRGRELAVGACVGIAMGLGSNDAVDSLLSNADRALYRAKNEGRCTWRMHGRDRGDPPVVPGSVSIPVLS